MPTIAKFREIHWRIVNVFLRIASVAFMFVGTIFIIWAISLLLRPTSTMDVDGIPTNATKEKADMLYAGLTAFGVGALVWLALPFRPDIGDVPFFRNRKKAIKAQEV